MINDIERPVALERELRSALAANRIVPHYQPVVSLDKYRIVGFEALARWESNRFGWVAPDQFILLAEELGLMGELGYQLLLKACFDAKRWPTDIALAVNVSATQLADVGFASRTLEALSAADLSTDRLELEITETAIVERVEIAQKILKELREAGIRIALDDFGTGYATLSQLLSFRIDTIKIDRRFVRNLGRDTNSSIIVRAILGLAEEFGLSTTAEGIEDADQVSFLRECGCKRGQGHLFGQAVPAEKVPHVLAQVEQLQHRYADR